ncbi:hypothetical protein BSKO_01188 [Bryopsis sp. KO-2023]|nr:hypothetical protein BSKO_01188 [Bryopsis sp. KO-2023]
MLARLRSTGRLSRPLLSIASDGCAGTWASSLEDSSLCQKCWMGRLPFQEGSSPSTSSPLDKATRFSAPEDATTAQLDLKTRIETAKTVTDSFMFPWEKRQMDGEGTPLRWWEKVYWWVFAGGTAVMLFTMGKRWLHVEQEPEIDEELEARKQAAARSAIVGTQGFHTDEDPFDGLSPEEIQTYVEQATGASDTDPFEGMSPEEINEWVEKNGGPPRGF